MYDTFLEWHEKKSDIHTKSLRVYFFEREVWWYSLGLNVGDEQNGKGKSFARPIIILKKFNNNVFWGIPLTSKMKTGKFYQSVDLGDGMQRTAILSQLRLIDGKRLLDRIAILSPNIQQSLARSIRHLLPL